ncbi:NADH-quinone oxidoreductase subunit NuoE [Candidatus Erwinia haradaeae]|uniref:NADH-quinone oxidoreductase subunit E n=1 Tax=Candidatus Erwinia haradaeae TaxID=1922217 RepID=A0A451D9A9_9GAMM|nr:NADH-quinone oxidoreductase subunit NuoE [Candidatus Erwinia haradaeae]VFP82813.1 NADH-quinone oxidoreductase subunit E [Candidatus Erwinia haradaeae]
MYSKRIKIHTLYESDDSTISDRERDSIMHEKDFYEDTRAIVIEALKIIQKERGWVSDILIKDIAHILDLPVSDVEGVATFYSQIYRRPVGRHIIRYCDSVVCYLMGYEIILSTLEDCLHIQPGQTTNDQRFTLLPTCCLGNCDKAPTMMIDTATYGNLTSEDISILLEKYE